MNDDHDVGSSAARPGEGVATPRGAIPEATRWRKCRGPGCGELFEPKNDEHWHHAGACRTRAWEKEHPRVGRPVAAPPRQATLDELKPTRPLDAGPPGKRQSKRLSNHCRLILARLEEGPASNRELTGTTHRFGARLKDLRDVGHDIRIIERDHASGRVVYRLFRKGGS